MNKVVRLMSVGTLVGVLSATGCDDRGNDAIVFFAGRAVETIGDSILAVTSSSDNALLVLDLNTNAIDTIGRGIIHSPFHVQFLDGRWYVSDVRDSKPAVRVFSRATDGEWVLVRDIDLTDHTLVPHQFAVLPDGRVVVEANDDRLIAVSEDSVTTFALTESGPRPSIIVAARGGVLHAVPDRYITLYNGFGNIRWRTEWPWSSDAFVTDIAIDQRSRIHVLAGIPKVGEGLFRVYSLVGETGEVVWWSDPGERATFSVNFFGDVTADDTGRWFR